MPAAAAPDRCADLVGAGPGSRLVALDPDTRLTWIDQHLSRTGRTARIWQWGWGGGIVVATGANLVPLAYVAPNNRIDWYTGAATTIVGIVPLLIAPLEVIEDSHVLRAKVSAHRAPDAPDRKSICMLLADAEERLVRDARNQEDGRRWWLHAGNLVLNSGVGLFLILGYRHWFAGVLNAVTGTAIGELIIFTQPTGSIEDLRRYRSGDLDGPPRALAYRLVF